MEKIGEYRWEIGQCRIGQMERVGHPAASLGEPSGEGAAPLVIRKSKLRILNFSASFWDELRAQAPSLDLLPTRGSNRPSQGFAPESVSASLRAASL